MGKRQRFFSAYEITNGKKFRLKDHDPKETGRFRSESHGKKRLEDDVDVLSELQQKLYAQDRWSILIVIQGMDAAGKDSLVKHVMSGVNPQGVQVTSFKAPSSEELDHDYLWRVNRHLSAHGNKDFRNRGERFRSRVLHQHPSLVELANRHACHAAL